MKLDDGKIAAARRASGMTIDDAASICGLSRPTYSMREQYAGDFRISELVSLRSALDKNGKTLFDSAISTIFLPSELR